MLLDALSPFIAASLVAAVGYLAVVGIYEAARAVWRRAHRGVAALPDPPPPMPGSEERATHVAVEAMRRGMLVQHWTAARVAAAFGISKREARLLLREGRYSPDTAETIRAIAEGSRDAR